MPRSAASTPSSPTQREAAVEFSFPAVDGEPVTSESTRGRVTVLLFLTTYDLASQLVASQLADVARGFTPRINVAAVALEPPRYAELLPAYRESLSLPYPVVMADFQTQSGEGPFGAIGNVPTLVILDREGRETWRHLGPVSVAEIERRLKSARWSPPVHP